MDPTRGRPRRTDPGPRPAETTSGMSFASSSSAQEMRRLMRRLTEPGDGFFREPHHFADLQRRLFVARPTDDEIRVWSATCGCGEEAYSVAMLLADKLPGRRWRVVGTDAMPARIAQARRALYAMERARLVPEAYLKSWCLRGTGNHEGQLLIGPQLRAHSEFEVLDVREPLPAGWPRFDAIFLRHALRGLDEPSRAGIVGRVIGHLKPDGVLYTGHGESLAALGLPLRELAPAIHARA